MHVYLYNKFLSYMAKRLGCVVFSPEYRLAPENPFPAADFDCLEATKHVFENAEKYKIDPKKIVFTGDSAGGTFSFVIWHR